MAKKNIEPSFTEQANAMIDNSYSVKVSDPEFGHGINIRDHKLLVSVMALHVDHVNDILVKKFAGVVAEHYGPIMAAIQRVEDGQVEIKKSIQGLSRRVTNTERRLARLEKNFNLLFEEHLMNHKSKIVIKKEKQGA